MNKKIIFFKLEHPSENDFYKINQKIISISQSWTKIDENFYLIKTEKTSVSIREIILGINLESSYTKIFISEWEHPSAWKGLSKELVGWIRNN